MTQPSSDTRKSFRQRLRDSEIWAVFKVLSATLLLLFLLASVGLFMALKTLQATQRERGSEAMVETSQEASDAIR